MNERLAKHLEFIQGVINRMASNSFLIKGWTITLVAAMFALAAKDSNVNFIIIAFFPALSFWGLDAYYLRQERLFRKLYNAIRLTKASEIDSIDPYSLDTTKYQKEVSSWFYTLWSSTVIAIHGIILLVVIIVIAYIKTSLLKGV